MLETELALGAWGLHFTKMLSKYSITKLDHQTSLFFLKIYLRQDLTKLPRLALEPCVFPSALDAPCPSLLNSGIVAQCTPSSGNIPGFVPQYTYSGFSTGR